MSKTDSKDQRRKKEEQRKPRAFAVWCWDGDSANPISQAPLPPGSHGWHQRESGQWEERRVVLSEVQLLRGIPPAAAESTIPRPTHLSSDCGCQLPPAELPKHSYIPHLPGICLSHCEAPPRKILVTPSLPFCYLQPRGGASCSH